MAPQLSTLRFSLQSGTAAGFELAPAELRRALLESPDWGQLDLESQAIGLTLGQQDETRPWLEHLASQDPARALELALRASQYSLRFVRSGKGIARVLKVTGPTSTAALPTPEFWRELRRTIWASAELRAAVRAIAHKHAPVDIRLRAGLAHALPDDPEWWSTADRAAALRETDSEAGALLLLALLRNQPRTLCHVCWPPPIYALAGLVPDELLAAHRWDPNGVSGLRPRAVSSRLISAAFRNIDRRDSLALLGSLEPSDRLLERARKAPHGGAVHQCVRRNLITAWERALQGSELLPPVQLRDGRTLMSALELAKLRGALRSRHTVILDDFARRAAPESLSQFAEHLFVQWLLDDAPPNGRWALEAAGRFPSDATSDAIAEFSLGRGRRLSCPEVLAQMGTPRALRRLAELSRARECRSERPAIASLFASVAVTHGLSANELEDRLFPDMKLPPRASVRLEPGLRVEVERDGKILPRNPDWDDAITALPAAVRRLERVMCEGPPMQAIVFTETWGMHPLLSAVARRLVWGVFSAGTRVGLLIPGRSSPDLGSAMGLRPLHPIELVPNERLDLGTWRLGQQPFQQLERPLFKRNDLREQDFSPDEFSAFTDSIEESGWERDGRLESWTRRGEGWAVRVGFNNFAMDGELRVVQSEFTIRGSPPARVISEIHRELAAGVDAANQCFARVTAYLE